MIKLNNKNITYVAFADSSNSIKAPKEIWYADSSNSVKLVYRRKDALIEGEDYEKYHWLKGDETAYIELDNQFNTDGNAFIDAHLKQYAQRSRGYDIIIGNNQSEDGYCIRITCAFANFYDLHKVVNGVANSYRLTKTRDDMEHNVHLSFSSIEFDGVGSTIVWGNQFDSKMRNKFTRIYSGYARYGEITMRSNNKEFLLTPCRLLRPIPKWLDANGIRRQVGECGMIDLVSGKFYGNVNSVGTFTVENYYERKEWLVGDGSAYINTKVKLHFATDSVYIKGRNNGVPTNDARYFGNYSGGQNAKSLELIYYTSVQNDTVSKPFVTDGRFGINPSSEFEFHTTPFSSTTSVSIIYDNIDTIFNVNLDDSYLNYEASNDLILLNTNDTRYCMKADVANFKVMRSSTIIRNLIPCTLTMDLPASMDANNIARTKGTSGMWDLVSDRFYGNVANSGTFKAVNLAEGVDYEVHQWLVGDGEALFNESINFQSAKWELSNVTKYAAFNVFEFNAETYAAFQIVAYPYNRTGIGIFDSTGGRGYLYTDVEDVNVIEIKSQTTSSSIVINETDFSNPALTIKPYFNLNRVAFGDVKCSSIVIDGIERYIPVKLLKSIPAKYDANGIARQVGECGMYDTVNDVFYGNVASSGTFSVSDDS